MSPADSEPIANDGLPKLEHVYQNHHLDSTRWEVIDPRDDDIIVTTSYKSGTTWTQQILLHLLYGEQDPIPDMHMISPWPDARFHGRSREQLAEQAAAIEGRRFMKSHLPLDGLPYWPQVRYVIVARDARDVFMSLFNHYRAYTDTAFQMLNADEIVGEKIERCPEDPRALWRDWMTRGWFDWESEGYPFWSNLHHTQSYWRYRHLPNFLLLHYNDMLADLEGAVRKVARFCRIEASEERIAKTVEATTFANVKKRAEALDPSEDMTNAFFEGGQKTFFFKGSNGRWRDVLTEDDLALYEEAKARVLTPDCAAWLEAGDLALQARQTS